MVDVDINYHRACCGLLPGGCDDGGGWSWKIGGKQVAGGGWGRARDPAQARGTVSGILMLGRLL